MIAAPSDTLIAGALSVFTFLALCAALVLVTVSLRRPSTPTLMAAAALVVACLVVVAVAPWNVPTLFGIVLALLGVALAVIGGNPLTRRVLALANGDDANEGASGGILVSPNEHDDRVEIMRGGTAIGYLERLAVVMTIVAGFPEGIAIVVALKGIGRFSELDTPATRERFIVGTLASLVWASLVGALVRLAIW